MRTTRWTVVAVCLVLWLSATRTAGQEASSRPIQDNSFLIEEAYNQEEGVVQHILTYLREPSSGVWQATFTQEWPVSGVRHQLSYTLPAGSAGGGTSAGAGDVALNYRWQAVGNGDARLAVAPRLSLLLPTGDEKRGLGAGTLSLQLNLPASVALSDAFVLHGNAGGTWARNARNERGEKADVTSANVGASVVWVGGGRLNALLETVWTSSQAVAGPGRTRREREILVSPGIRRAFDLAGGLQVVPGIAFPIGVGPSAGQRSVFVYLSFEHAFRRVSRSAPPKS